MRTETHGSITIPELEEAAMNFSPRNKPWTEEDEAVMREYYGRVSVQKLADYLNRSRGSVTNKAQEMGIACKR